ncbi:MAG: DNA helicase RecQ [Phycisphaerae bacterium]|jgi:ATP-dependent DNA helicase RecQ|nr:DNA helicase RecQ [Phycisphaerae bacterium]
MPALDEAARQSVHELLRRHFGYDSLRPLQAEAIAAGLARQDSLVVLPTGGGKSICYQMPPLIAQRLDVVVSPLIALMKDQVDGLVANGYPAAALHSGMSEDDRAAVRHGLQEGRYRLLFVSPERLSNDAFVAGLRRYGVSSFAIDEAHCISQWGHDFRPEYRQLARLRELFPGASLHAFTATATPRVREDIREQLALREPVELVGNFDRPNLTYRIVPRIKARDQTIEILSRHHGEAGIVYCLSRRETEEMAAALVAAGIKAAHYHAGLSADQRNRTQEQFSEEKLDVVVATVAFGMGIDRGDVRCVIHAAMPKSIEHYQQETGRAGRDGLEAECVLLHSPADSIRWEGLMRRSTSEAEGDPATLDAALDAQLKLLRDMQRFCSAVTCRHRALCRYFGQESADADAPGGCGACDCCLGEVETLHDSTLAARQILSAVARVQQRFGAKHVADVLHGAASENVIKWGHQELSVYGLMRERPLPAIQNLVYQLVDAGLLASTGGDRPVLTLTPHAMPVLKGEVEVTLLRPRIKAKATKSAVAEAGWKGVDRDLFEWLRQLRRRIAERIGKPPYVVFADETLREMARRRPSTLEGFARLRGVGARKLRDYGDEFLAAIEGSCRERGLGRDMES